MGDVVCSAIAVADAVAAAVVVVAVRFAVGGVGPLWDCCTGV